MSLYQETPPTFDRISDFVHYYAGHTPDAEALVLDDIRITYRELAYKIDNIAKALLKSGIRKGDRVATLSPPHPDFFITFLAASSIGAIWLGLNPRYQLDEYKYVLGDSEPTLLFANAYIGDRDYRSDIDALISDIPCIQNVIMFDGDYSHEKSETLGVFTKAGEEISDEALAHARSLVSSSDAALIVYTSGTTGKPKGAVLPHRGLITCYVQQATHYNVTGLKVLNFLPINHIGCVGDISCFSLIAGGTIVFMEKFDPRQSLELIQKEKISWLGCVPTALQMMFSVPDFESFDLSSVQIAAWSGASAPRDLVEKLLEKFPLVSNFYGMTETVGSVTYAGPCRDIDLLVETIGAPVPGYEVRLVTPQGIVACPGEEGEIQVRGDFIMKGYWRRPEITAETISSDGWFQTGDLAVKDVNGNIKLVGRLKEMFISGGYNVFPKEIEKVLESHPLISMAAVLSIPDSLFGETGVAFVIPEAGSKISSADLASYCRLRLANYKIPKQFILQREFPMLPIGKIDKSALKKQVLN